MKTVIMHPSDWSTCPKAETRPSYYLYGIRIILGVAALSDDARIAPAFSIVNDDNMLLTLANKCIAFAPASIY